MTPRPADLPAPPRSTPSARATRVSAFLLIWMMALGPMAAHAARSKAITCTVSGTGGTMLTTIALPGKPSKRLTLKVNKAGDSSQGFASNATVTRGHRTVMTVDSTLSPTGTFVATVTFGHGFRGVRELSLTSDDGQTFRTTLDGLPLLPFVAGADVSSLRFATDGRIPRSKVKRFIARGIEKLTKVPLESCTTVPGPSASDRIQPRVFDPRCFLPFGDCGDCDTCFLACNAYNASCRISAGAAGGACVAASVAFTAGAVAPACLAAWAVAEAGCLKSWIDCGKNCERSIDACGGHLGERCGPTRTCGGDDKCCGGPDNDGDCCSNTDACCGKRCLEQTGNLCADPGRGVVCHAGAGDVCNDALDPSACCPSETPACLAYGVPPGGPGSLPGGGVCCRRDQVFAQGCCDPADLCGEVCCPSRVCLNGNTCCAPPEFAVCGGNCCPALTTSCCNGQCCAGTCLNNSLCCPRTQVCGDVCCAAGSACVDPATGTCQPCLAGTEPCEYAAGSPRCCPFGTQCCGNGQCCAAPNGQCCAETGQGPVCAETCLR